MLTAAEACSGLEQQFETITSDVNPYDILSPCFQNGPQFTSQLYSNITDALQRNGSVVAPNYTTGYFGSSDVPCTDDRFVSLNTQCCHVHGLAKTQYLN